MQNMMLMVLLCSLPAGAMAGTCLNAGYVFKTDLTTETCEMSVSNAACQGTTTNAGCCKLDIRKCSNYATLDCGADKFSMVTASAGNIGDKTTNDITSAATDCCITKSTCKDLDKCTVAGYKKDTTKDTTKCPTDAKSCNTATSGCCIKDDEQCGGQATLTCAAGKYGAPSVGAMVDSKPDATRVAYGVWLAKATTANTSATDCCATKATCAAATYTCPAGQKKKETGDCDKDADSCAATCCEADVAKCGGITATCTTGVPGSDAAWKNTAATDVTFQTACCKTAPVCTAVTCTAGWIANPNATSTCTDQSATHGSCYLACCDKDPATCGGLMWAATPKTCAVTTYTENEAYDAATTSATKNKFYGKKATAATFEADCCTKKASCATFKSWTAPGSGLIAGTQQVHPGLFTVFVGLSTFAALWKM